MIERFFCSSFRAALVACMFLLLAGFAPMAVSETLSISDFGTFNVKKVASKAGRNPMTGEAITCAPTVRITFKPSSAVKDKVITAVWAGKSRAVAVPAKAAVPAIKPRAQAPVMKG